MGMRGSRLGQRCVPLPRWPGEASGSPAEAQEHSLPDGGIPWWVRMVGPVSQLYAVVSWRLLRQELILATTVWSGMCPGPHPECDLSWKAEADRPCRLTNGWRL